jgi:predicted  nucleic acid-binding Zn-ribbon protein
MGYYNNSELQDVADELEELIDEYKDYDSIELVENAEEFEEKLDGILSNLKDAMREVSDEYDKLESEKDDIESEKDDLESEIEDLKHRNDILSTAQHATLYDLQKKRVCLDMYNNLTLEELEQIEATVRSQRKNYSTSLLSDVEIN